MLLLMFYYYLLTRKYVFDNHVNKPFIYRVINALTFVSLYLHPWSRFYCTLPIKRDFSHIFQRATIPQKYMIL